MVVDAVHYRCRAYPSRRQYVGAFVSHCRTQYRLAEWRIGRADFDRDQLVLFLCTEQKSGAIEVIVIELDGDY